MTLKIKEQLSLNKRDIRVKTETNPRIIAPGSIIRQL